MSLRNDGSADGNGGSAGRDRQNPRSVQSDSNANKPARYWMLTIPVDSFEPVLPDGVGFIKGQQEIGDGGFHHWQLMLILRNPQRLSWIRSTFGPFHAERTISSRAEAYVWKEDSRVPGTGFAFKY